MVKLDSLVSKVIIVDSKQYEDFIIYQVRYLYEKSIESMTLGYPKLKNMIKNYGKKILHC